MSILASRCRKNHSVPVVTAVTWNPLDKNPNVTLSNFNLDANVGGATFYAVRSNTSRSTGKFYFEIEKLGSSTNQTIIGIATSAADLTLTIGRDVYGWGLQSDYPPGGYSYHNNVGGLIASLNGISCAQNGRAMFAVDFVTGKIWMGMLGTFDGNPAAGTGATYTFTPNTQLFIAGSTNSSIRIHAGGDAFTYPIPAGFSAWQS